MKFAVGDKAIYTGSPGFGVSHEDVGSIVIILGVGIENTPEEDSLGFEHYGNGDICYWVEWHDGDTGACPEYELRKLPGDSIPASTLAIFSKKQPNPDKVKETV